MVDPRMAQATAVQTKIAMIATMRFNMVVCVPTLSAAPPNLCPEVGHVKYFSLQSEGESVDLPCSIWGRTEFIPTRSGPLSFFCHPERVEGPFARLRRRNGRCKPRASPAEP